MSDSVRPHRRQPTRLRRPWDSPGKNTGVGCHFLLQCMKLKSESEVAQSCQILHDLMDCSLSGSSIHGVFQARVLEWGAIAFQLLITGGTAMKPKARLMDLTDDSSRLGGSPPCTHPNLVSNLTLLKLCRSYCLVPYHIP